MTGSSTARRDVAEPGPFEIIRPAGKCAIVLVCDHASNRIPARLDRLGMSEHQLQSHIAWDIGAAALANKLSLRLDATLVLSNYSRLVIDCNRLPAHPESIPTSSAGIVIPGNADVSELEIQRRQRSLLLPYQQAIAGVLEARKRSPTRLLSIHSFTPSLNGNDRHWPVGVCYNKSRPWAGELMRALASRCEEPVGNNQPYAVEPDYDYTIPQHGERRGIPSLMLELRQDGLQDDLGIQHWCNILGASLEQVNG